MVQFQELKISPDGSKLIIDVSVEDREYFKDVYIESIIIDSQDTYSPLGPSRSPIYIKTLYSNNTGWIFDASSVFGDDYIGEGFPKWDAEYNEWDWSYALVEEDTIPYLKVFKYNGKYYRWNEPDVVFGEAFGPNGTINLQYFSEINIEQYRPKDYPKTVHLEINSNELLTTSVNNLYFIYVKTTGTPASDTPCGMDNMITLKVITNFYPLYQQVFGYIKELSGTCIIPKNFINFILQYKAIQLAVKTGHYTEAIKYWEKFHFSQGIKDVTITNKCGCYG